MRKLLFLDRIGDIVALPLACRHELADALTVRTVVEDSHFPAQRGRARELALVLSGIARVYVETADGRDVTQYFARAEDFVIADLDSARGQLDRIEAITEVQYAGLPLHVFEGLLARYPALAVFLGAYYNEAALRARERQERRARSEAVDTYADFLQSHPGLETQVPTAHLASYLGLSTSEFMRARQKYRQRGIM